MGFPTRTPVAAIIAALVLAGCSGGGGSSDGPATVPSASVGEETGAIEGLVVDDSFTALSGATVGIPTLNATTVTDGQGRFALSGLPVGKHNLFAERFGYESAAKRVDVLAGEVTQAQFELAPVVVEEVYSEATEYVGFMNCGLGVGVSGTGLASTSACTQDQNHRTNFDFDVLPNVQTAIGELTWQASASVAAQNFRLNLWQNPRCSPCDPEFQYGESQGPNPVILRADSFRGISEDDNTTLHWYVWTPVNTADGVPFVIVVNQRFSIWSSVFYGEPAPTDYSAIPDE